MTKWLWGYAILAIDKKFKDFIVISYNKNEKWDVIGNKSK